MKNKLFIRRMKKKDNKASSKLQREKKIKQLPIHFSFNSKLL